MKSLGRTLDKIAVQIAETAGWLTWVDRQRVQAFLESDFISPPYIYDTVTHLKTSPPEEPATKDTVFEPSFKVQTMQRQSDVFISYASEDRARVAQLVKMLDGMGWSIFWDRRISPGELWPNHIKVALEQAKCVVVVWSKHSIGSEWVREEAEDGKHRKILVPVRIDPVLPPLGFRGIHTEDLCSWNALSLPRTEAMERVLNFIADKIGQDTHGGKIIPSHPNYLLAITILCTVAISFAFLYNASVEAIGRNPYTKWSLLAAFSFISVFLLATKDRIEEKFALIFFCLSVNVIISFFALLLRFPLGDQSIFLFCVFSIPITIVIARRFVPYFLTKFFGI